MSITGIILVSALGFCACKSAEGASEISPSASGEVDMAATLPSAERRRFDFRYEVTVPPHPDVHRLRIWIPMPREVDGVQAVRELKVHAPATAQQTRDPIFGNRILYVETAGNSEPMRLAWEAVIERKRDHGQGTGSMNPRYLAPNRMIPLEGEATRLARQLGVRDDARPVEGRARVIYDDVLAEMSYDKQTPGWGRGDFVRAVEVCKGNCTDFHARFTGTARAAEIPVRFTMGIPLKPTPEGQYNSYHCWAHFRDGQHWVPVDISEADKAVSKGTGSAEDFFATLDPHRITLTYGRDLVLEPPQAREPLQYFVFPYVEGDGVEVDLAKKDWGFTWREHTTP